MIPKKIHYIWLGQKKINNTSKLCINSWKRVFHDYEIKLWNEENLDLDNLKNKNRFLKECINRNLWAFASDYLRLYILYNEGGIYMDADVEAIQSFGELLNEKCFIGLEANDYIGTGVIGAEKHNHTIGRLLQFYDKEIWDVDFFNNPIIFKHLYENESSDFEGCNILDRDFFSPYNPYEIQKGLIGTDKTICIHWYNASWGMSRKGYVFLMTKHIKKPIQRVYQILRKNIGFYRKKNNLNI